ncbi:hypothetical protein GTX23_12310, partial [Streptomyces sp. SID6139]|nr:hypothetical protein [Streptomyces sp. SID6139]
RMKDIGTELQRRTAWTDALNAGQVTAYRIGNTVTVQAPSGTYTNATLPTGSTLGTGAFGSAYAGELSGWTAATATPLTFTLPAAAPAATPGTHGHTHPAATAPAPRTRLPKGVSKQVPYAPRHQVRHSSQH